MSDATMVSSTGTTWTFTSSSAMAQADQWLLLAPSPRRRSGATSRDMASRRIAASRVLRLVSATWESNVTCLTLSVHSPGTDAMIGMNAAIDS